MLRNSLRPLCLLCVLCVAPMIMHVGLYSLLHQPVVTAGEHDTVPTLRFTGAEDRRANPHDRRAFLDGRLEVVAHAHAQMAPVGLRVALS